MAAGNGRKHTWGTTETLEPVSGMLDSGRCELFKAGVHGLMLATVALCAAYNAAAWLKRRERHLAINAVVYSAAVWWERAHVLHHLADCPAAPLRESRTLPEALSIPAATGRDAA
jgi:hypothetical protein